MTEKKTYQRRLKITLISDVTHILTITLKKSGSFPFQFRMNVPVEYQLSVLPHKK